jgi:hypothetical protein
MWSIPNSRLGENNGRKYLEEEMSGRTRKIKAAAERHAKYAVKQSEETISALCAVYIIAYVPRRSMRMSIANYAVRRVFVASAPFAVDTTASVHAPLQIGTTSAET